MQAVVCHAAHDLRVEPVEVADELRAGEVRVRVEAGGICGSDLHYYHNGGFGTVRIREPMVLGHEVAGRVIAVGANVTSVRDGDRVALSPSRPCGQCRYCQEGHQNHCLDMRFYGSAMRFPHVQGAFQQEIVADAAQCHIVADGVSPGEAAMAEPLAVCLHAVRRAGPMLGKRVLVTGFGPIGALCALAARQAGAVEVVATDVTREAVARAEALGIDRALDVAARPDALAPYGRDKGTFDVMLEASGAQQALVGALEALRPGAVIVQVGIGGEVALPMTTLVAKELELRGSFRFHEEFQLAVELINQRRIDVARLVTATLPFGEARKAFDLASDRKNAMKVQLAFT